MSGRMHKDCEECRRLRQEYAIAIRTHIGLEYTLRDAPKEDLSQIQALAEQVYEADLVRDNLREAIRNHEEKAHGKNQSAAG